MTLNPREIFTIVRQIENHTDTSTYYVRAVIRNAKTDAIITVNGNNYLNLTDRGSQRFSQSWAVPSDPSGQGFYISILTSVYTDSGYTTKSENYGDKMDIYLVAERYNHNLGGVGGGADISYKMIRRIVDEVVKERLANDIEIPEAPEPKIITTEKVVVSYKKHPKIEIPPFPSFRPVLSAIEKVANKVDAIEIPEPKEMDMKPMEECLFAVNEVKKMMKDDIAVEMMGDMKEKLDTIEKLTTPPPPPPKPVVSPYKIRAERMLGKSEIDEKLKARIKKFL